MIYKQREGEKTCKDICIYQSVYRRCTFLTYGFLQKMRPVPVLRPLRHQRESLKVWVSWDVKIL